MTTLTKASKEQKQEYVTQLVFFANKLGYGVDFEEMEGEGTPSGLCHTSPTKKMIYIRKGEGLNGTVTSLVHEIVHAMNRRAGLWFLAPTGNALEEWECESVAHFVTQLLGVDRREQTTKHVESYVGVPVFSTSDRVLDYARSIYHSVAS